MNGDAKFVAFVLTWTTISLASFMFFSLSRNAKQKRTVFVSLHVIFGIGLIGFLIQLAQRVDLPSEPVAFFLIGIPIVLTVSIVTTKFCSHCGRMLTRAYRDRFCRHCGQPLK